jgi:hypothetical protein
MKSTYQDLGKADNGAKIKVQFNQSKFEDVSVNGKMLIFGDFPNFFALQVILTL